LSGTTEGAERRRSALGRLIKTIFVPTVIGLVGCFIFLSKFGADLGLQEETPHKLLGTLEESYASSVSGDKGSSPELVEKPVEKLAEESVKKTESKKRAAVVPTATPETEVVIKDTSPTAIPEVAEPTLSPQIAEKAELSDAKQDIVTSQSPATAQESFVAPSTVSNRSIFPATFGFGKSMPILLTEDLELFRLMINGCSGTWVIEGHSDGVGSPARNDSLSRSRASAVSQLLLSKGLLADGDRYEVTSMGGTRPIADDSTEEGRAANRRVEIWCR
jgi:outer membrane protein OmpA-like peptidoglycan-associated protein